MAIVIPRRFPQVVVGQPHNIKQANFLLPYTIAICQGVRNKDTRQKSVISMLHASKLTKDQLVHVDKGIKIEQGRKKTSRE